MRPQGHAFAGEKIAEALDLEAMKLLNFSPIAAHLVQIIFPKIPLIQFLIVTIGKT
jgi:hypothetical protein